MYTISPIVYAAVLKRSILAYPSEAVGVLITSRHANPGDLDGYANLTNISDDPTHRFAVDPAAQLATWKVIDDAYGSPAVVWHSHTSGLLEPSREDIDNHDPTLGLGLLNLHDPMTPHLKIYKIDDNNQAIPVEVVLQAGV
jgi:proteasome lid subunit RPN8/RPN11